MHHERGTEGDGEIARPFVVEIGADLREIGPMIGPGVQIDAHIGALDDLGHEEVRDPSGQRPVGRAGERPVEVPTVREVAVAVEEPVHVDDRDGHDRPCQRARVDRAERAADDLDPADLVAVHRCTEPDHRAVLPPVEHVDRDRDPGAGHQPGHRQLSDGGPSGRDVEIPDRERGSAEQAPTARHPRLRTGGRIEQGVGHERLRLRRRTLRSGRPVA